MKLRNDTLKRAYAFILTCMLLLSVPSVGMYASSLDDIVNGSTQKTEQSVQENNQPVENQQITSSRPVNNTDYIAAVKDATKLDEVSEEANSINQYIKKGVSFFIQVASYFITAMLAAKIILDMVYITIPQLRVFLANGYTGNVQAGVGAADGGSGFGTSGMMGGMNNGMMGGMNGGMMNGGMNGGMYGGGGYGMNRYGMNRGMMGGMNGMNGGMNGMMQQQNMRGANPILGRIQWVSSAAMNAVAAESTPGMDGKPDNALKVYAKNMVVELILTPILLVLAISGALTDLGFLLGDFLVDGISQIGGMI